MQRLFLLIFFIIFTNKASFSFNNLIDFINKNNVTGLQRALEAGSDPDLRGNYGITPLMASISRQNEEAAKILIKYGADINATDIAGVSPLHIASRNGNIELVKILIKAGADVNAKDKYGLTPLAKAKASQKNAVVQYLLDNNAKDVSSELTENHNTPNTTPIAVNASEPVKQDQVMTTKVEQIKVANKVEKKRAFSISYKETGKNNSELFKSDKKEESSVIQNMKQHAVKTEPVKKAVPAPVPIEDTEDIDLAWKREQPKVKSVEKSQEATPKAQQPQQVATSFTTKKGKKVIVGKARLVANDGISKWKVDYNDLVAFNNKSNSGIYWLMVETKKTKKYSMLLNKAIKQVQNYKIKYQIVQNMKTKEKYLKIGPVPNDNISNVYCKRLLEDPIFTDCKIIKVSDK